MESQAVPLGFFVFVRAHPAAGKFCGSFCFTRRSAHDLLLRLG
jgi:hypothetical protein